MITIEPLPSSMRGRCPECDTLTALSPGTVVDTAVYADGNCDDCEITWSQKL